MNDTNSLIYRFLVTPSVPCVYRNPAAYADVMSIEKAELCGDYLIKERRVLYNFLDKIKDEYKKRS